MKDTQRFLALLVAGICISLSATAASANTSTLKCNWSKDRVWVYDSLTTFDVEAKLNCGETVEIIGRVKDYVQIRAHNGVEGYVPDAAFSDLPEFVAYRDPRLDVGAVAKQVQAKEIAKAAASESSLLTPDTKSQNSSSALPVGEQPVQQPSRARHAAENSLLPFNTLAEIGPHPSPAPVTKISSDATAKDPIAQPIVPPAKALDSTPTPPPAAAAGLPAISTTIPSRSDDTGSSADESPDPKFETESADPACQRYFSAYGLTLSQLKWIASNRKRMYPSVCPAPDPSKVNFVIIFTHDVDFFNATMPEPVHNLNGFSDFQPMTTVDTALVPESGADKAHREYVWIFQCGAGGFNPATFSPHSKYQFTKVETNSLGSKAAPKVVEDAFRFLEGTNR